VKLSCGLTLHDHKNKCIFKKKILKKNIKQMDLSSVIDLKDLL